jgi:DMSO reductase anchor subunit
MSPHVPILHTNILKIVIHTMTSSMAGQKLWEVVVYRTIFNILYIFCWYYYHLQSINAWIMDNTKLAYFMFDYVEGCTKCGACKGYSFEKETTPKPQGTSDTEQCL